MTSTLLSRLTSLNARSAQRDKQAKVGTHDKSLTAHFMRSFLASLGLVPVLSLTLCCLVAAAIFQLLS